MANTNRRKDTLPDSGPDELERFFGPREKITPAENFPYPYESDVFFLWGWGQRIDARLRKDAEVNGFDPGYFRPDTSAQDAMQRLAIAYPESIKQIRDELDGANAYFENALAGNPTAVDAFWEYLLHLEMRINSACRTIHETQTGDAPPKTHGQTTPAFPRRLTAKQWVEKLADFESAQENNPDMTEAEWAQGVGCERSRAVKGLARGRKTREEEAKATALLKANTRR